MLRSVMTVLVALMVTGGSVYAEERYGAPGAEQRQAPAAERAPGRTDMEQSPAQMLAVGYHRNLAVFARTLERMARQGDTVPVEEARAAVTEMKRSAAQMEYYRSEALRGLPAGGRDAGRIRDMEGHAARMRDSLARLEELTKAQRVDSAELLRRLQPLLGDRGGISGGMADCGPAQDGYGGKMQRHDLRHECHECMLHGGNDEVSCRHCMEMHSRGQGGGQPGMMGPHPGKEQGQGMMQMRQQMLEQMKKQDAELARLVDQMNSAPPERKQALMAEILTRMVQQRADFYRHMEKMHQQMGPRYEQGYPMEDEEEGDIEDNEDTNDEGYQL